LRAIDEKEFLGNYTCLGSVMQPYGEKENGMM